MYSVTWSSNGLISASLDRTMKRWRLSDLSTVECVSHFEGHQDLVLSAVEDNTLVLSRSKDRSVGLWDPVTGKQMLWCQPTTTQSYRWLAVVNQDALLQGRRTGLGSGFITCSSLGSTIITRVAPRLAEQRLDDFIRSLHGH